MQALREAYLGQPSSFIKYTLDTAFFQTQTAFMWVPITLIVILTSSSFGQAANFRFETSPKVLTECACARDLTFRVSNGNSLWQPSSVTIWAKQVDGNWIQIGTLNDNGQNGDETAGDGQFGLAASYSVPFIGSTAIEARVVVNGQTQTAQINFSVVRGIAVSDDSSLKGLSADGVNSLWFDSTHPDATRFILDRAASSSGTWNQLESRDFPASNEAQVTGKMWDESADASTHDWFYRIRSFNSSGSLLETYGPVFIAAYRDDGWDLCFDQTASSWKKCTAQAAPPIKKNDIQLRASTSNCSASPWNEPFVTDEEFVCSSCMTLREVRQVFEEWGSYFRNPIPDVSTNEIIDVPQLVYDEAVARELNPAILDITQPTAMIQFPDCVLRSLRFFRSLLADLRSS